MSSASTAPPAVDHIRPGAERAARFGRRATILLSTLVPATLAITLAASLLNPVGGRGTAHGANTFSVSALGFRALTELIEASGTPVVSSQHESGQRATPDHPLVVLSPGQDEDSLSELASLIDRATVRGAPVVVVLPKWRSQGDPERPSWVDQVALVDDSDATRVLAHVLDGEKPPARSVVRWSQGDVVWQSHVAAGSAPVVQNPQLIAGTVDGLEPLVWCEHGTLVGLVHSEFTRIVIADPDLLNNAGLHRGDNGVLALELLVEYLDAHGLVFDETIHGFTRAPTIWAELTHFPLNLVTLQLVLILGALLWSAAGRFGAPISTPARYPAGIEALIEGTARLLRLAQRESSTIEDYWRLTVTHTAEDLAVEPDTGTGSVQSRLVRRLHRLAGSRGIDGDLEQLSKQVHQVGGRRRHQLVPLARALHRFRMEMVNGPHGNR